MSGMNVGGGEIGRSIFVPFFFLFSFTSPDQLPEHYVANATMPTSNGDKASLRNGARIFKMKDVGSESRAGSSDCT